VGVHSGPSEAWFGWRLQFSGEAPNEQPAERSQLACGPAVPGDSLPKLITPFMQPALPGRHAVATEVGWGTGVNWSKMVKQAAVLGVSNYTWLPIRADGILAALSPVSWPMYQTPCPIGLLWRITHCTGQPVIQPGRM